MKPRDVVDLLLLAALWGASFLFMRIAAPQLGAVPMAALRVAGAAMLLLPLLAWQRAKAPAPAPLRPHWRAIALIGVTNSALPFAAFGAAALFIPAALSSILNATAPMFAALIAALWLREPIGTPRVVGLAIGFAGVAGLTLRSIDTSAPWSANGAALAIGLCLGASVLYGFSACLARRRLAGVDSLAVAALSQLSAALALALPAALWWPRVTPSLQVWAAVAALAVLCTGIAYVLYFRLIARVGPARAITVTFLVPAFAMVWGSVFLGEAVTPWMLAMCALILLGTALTTGLLKPRAVRAATGQ